MEKTDTTLYDKFKEGFLILQQSLNRCLEECPKIANAELVSLLIEKAKKEATDIIYQAETLNSQLMLENTRLKHSLDKIKANYTSLREDFNLKEQSLSNSEEQLSIIRNKLFKKEEELAQCQANLKAKEAQLLVAYHKQSIMERTQVSLKNGMKNMTLNYIHHDQFSPKSEKSKLINDQAKLNNELSKENNYVLEEVEHSLCNNESYNSNEQKLLKAVVKKDNDVVVICSLQKCWSFIQKHLSESSYLYKIVNVRINSMETFQNKLNNGKFVELLNCCMLIICDIVRKDHKDALLSTNLESDYPDASIAKSINSVAKPQGVCLTSRNHCLIKHSGASTMHSNNGHSKVNYTIEAFPQASTRNTNTFVSSFTQLNKLAGKIRSNRQEIYS